MSTPVLPHRRVRDQARDAAVLMAFSAAVSVGFAAVLLLVTSLGA
jgi:hypothetical protein